MLMGCRHYGVLEISRVPWEYYGELAEVGTIIAMGYSSGLGEVGVMVAKRILHKI